MAEVKLGMKLTQSSDHGEVGDARKQNRADCFARETVARRREQTEFAIDLKKKRRKNVRKLIGAKRKRQKMQHNVKKSAWWIIFRTDFGFSPINVQDKPT